jgi:galactokinase
LNATNDPPVRLLTKFSQVFANKSPQIVVQAPDREMWAAASFNGTAHCTVYTADSSEARTSFSYQSAKRKQTIQRRPIPRWARYLAGISVMLDVPEMPGLDVVVCGDEPAGPRYDFALGILFAALMYEINMEDCDPDVLQEVTERVRREYIEGQPPRAGK